MRGGSFGSVSTGLADMPRGRLLGRPSYGGRSGREPLHQDTQGCGVARESSRHYRGELAQMGHRPSRPEAQGSSLRGFMPREARSGGPHPWGDRFKEDRRGRSMDRKLDRGGRKAGELRSSPPPGRGEREEGRGKGSSAKAAAEEEKSEAKKKKKKKKRSEERGRSPEKSKEKIDLKSGARKELKEVFGGTGLDPDPRFRRRYAVKAQKKTKKRKRDSYSTGSSSSGKTTTSESVEVFEEQQKVRRLSKRAPGVLAALAMREMQTSLLTATGGLWQQDQTAIQPLAVQYFRQSLAPRLQGGPGREGLTLCWAIDLALQGRMAECVDALVQRLKSVEMVSQGSAWQIAQRLEVLPPERPLLSSRGEAKEAIREQKEEQKTRNEASKGKSKSDTWHWRDPGSEGKGKEAKGKGKKGKDKGDRGDQKK